MSALLLTKAAVTVKQPSLQQRKGVMTPLLVLVIAMQVQTSAGSMSCMDSWANGPFHQGPPMYHRDSFEQNWSHAEHLAKRLYERPMSLPEHILDRGLSNTGDVLRLRHLFQKLEAGQPINIVVIGGSITVPDDTDLLFMEFTVNDNMGIDRERGGGLPGLPVMENEWRRGFERMLRLAYQLPSQPAMFYLHTYQPEYEQHSFWQGDGFADEQVHCGVHPNPLGHIYYADIVIAALQDIAFHTLTKVSHHMHKDLFRSLTSLPAPMLEDNYESNNDCVKDGALKDAAVMGQTQGWEWVDEGKPGQPSKWGWRTLEPLQSIVIETPSTMSSLAGYQGDTLLGIGYLESFNHMGSTVRVRQLDKDGVAKQKAGPSPVLKQAALFAEPLCCNTSSH
ncbi:hypothetical protein WJX79_001072 [Trebouxia sp. C0005]